MSTSLDDLQAAGAGLGLSVRVHNVALRELASNGELCPDDEHKIDNEAKLAAALHAAWDRDKLNDFTLSVIRLDFAGIIRARHQGLNRTLCVFLAGLINSPWYAYPLVDNVLDHDDVRGELENSLKFFNQLIVGRVVRDNTRRDWQPLGDPTRVHTLKLDRDWDHIQAQSDWVMGTSLGKRKARDRFERLAQQRLILRSGALPRIHYRAITNLPQLQALLA